MTTCKDLERFTASMIRADIDNSQWPPPVDLCAQLHFEKSQLPRHIRVFVNGTWYEVATAVLVNGIFTLCPYDGPTKTPPPPLRPVPR